MNDIAFIHFNPQAINDIGARSNNEDAIYPVLGEANAETNLFIVCDGVGGSNNGEIASHLVCDLYAEFFQSHFADIHNQNYISDSILAVEEKLQEYLKEYPHCEGMATTLTSLSFHNQGATIAWIGDSRVYHVRDGKILFQTKDHSYVNFLIEQAEITEQEAKNHSKKNMIMRAIQSSEYPVQPEIKLIEDIRAGDYFLLCTDGLLENITDEIIQENLIGSNNPEFIKNRFYQLTHGNTNDNFSMYLLKIKQINQARNFSENPVKDQLEKKNFKPDDTKIELISKKSKGLNTLSKTPSVPKLRLTRMLIPLIILFAIIGAFGTYRYINKSGESTISPLESIESKDQKRSDIPIENADSSMNQAVDDLKNPILEQQTDTLKSTPNQTPGIAPL